MRKTRGMTLEEVLFPNLPLLTDPNHWSLRWSNSILQYIWEGYDLFKAETLTKIDFSLVTIFIENSVTELLLPCIREKATGNIPFDIEHEIGERETAIAGQTPRNDIVFILREKRRLKYPLEAKALKFDTKAVLEEERGYIESINTRFLTGKYAPFSSEGAMLGYLINGSPNRCLENIATSLGVTLTQDEKFPLRPHKFSEHTRTLSNVKNTDLHPFCPKLFRLHHLILEIKS